MTQHTHIEKKTSSGGKDTKEATIKEVESVLKKMGLTEDEIK